MTLPGFKSATHLEWLRTLDRGFLAIFVCSDTSTPFSNKVASLRRPGYTISHKMQTWLQTRCRRSVFKSVVAIVKPLVPGAGIEPARLSAGDFESPSFSMAGAACSPVMSAFVSDFPRMSGT